MVETPVIRVNSTWFWLQTQLSESRAESSHCHSICMLPLTLSELPFQTDRAVLWEALPHRSGCLGCCCHHGEHQRHTVSLLFKLLLLSTVIVLQVLENLENDSVLSSFTFRSLRWSSPWCSAVASVTALEYTSSPTDSSSHTVLYWDYFIVFLCSGSYSPCLYVDGYFWNDFSF